MEALLCPWDAPQFIIVSDNIPKLFFYSHIPAMVIAILIGLFVYAKSGKSKVGKILLALTSLFFLWSLFDLILWATNKPGDVLFFWSLQIFAEILIFCFGVFLTYFFVNGERPAPFTYKIGFLALLLPVIALLATRHNLAGVTLETCTAIEGFVASYYSYVIEIICVVAIIGILIRAHRRVSKESWRQIRAFGFGITLFLAVFLWGNVLGSFTDNWALAQAGLIGMPIFVAFLAYLIVRFKTFNIRLLGAQALIYALAFLVLSILFIRTIQNVRIVTIFTLVLIVLIGTALIRSVRNEVKQRERLEVLTKQLESSKWRLEESNLKLEVANTKLESLDKLKTEFLSLAAHQLRSPLTAIRGYASMLLDGSFGSVDVKQNEAINRVFESATHLSKIVEDLLNVSKIEAGGMKYEMALFDIEKPVKDISTDLSITAEKKGLALTFSTDNAAPYMVNGDMEKIRQVILNIIDNAIKYTEKGSVAVKLFKDASRGMVCVAVTDTGMGISAEEKERLFQKFSRGAGGKINTTGSGLGLYLAKQIAEAHGGEVVIESLGVGKGSTFTIELKAA